MPIPAAYLPAAYSMTAMGVWGVSDFIGGLGVRRVNAFLFTTLVHFSGMAAMLAITLGMHEPLPDRTSLLWSLVAGSIGGLALALFYRALATGKMGLTAPVAAVLGAGIPTVVTAFAAGLPGGRHLVGFLLAGIGVWLISRTEDGSGHPEGLGLAIIAGCGFAGFYLCVHQASPGASAAWVAVVSRAGSFLAAGVAMLLGRNVQRVPARALGLAVFAGFLEITGSLMFVRAQQAGRLDAAVVLSSLYPAITVLLARVFLHEHFSRGRTLGMMAALVAVPMIAA
jgi:drug/metabolite transporter (DMT)-like permease